MCVHCYCVRRSCNENPVRREVGTNRLKDSIVLGNEGEEREREERKRLIALCFSIILLVVWQ